MNNVPYTRLGRFRKDWITRLLRWASTMIAVLAGCDLVSTNAQYELFLSLSDVKHVIWTFDSQLQDGTRVDLSSFEPFNLIFAEGDFFGDDGCNFYGAKYEIQSDRIVPIDLAITDQLCDIQSLPVDHLVESF
ncbi:META domain-containing protein, partial [bacterium]|nr:META domain-containing protein [bacterium]